MATSIIGTLTEFNPEQQDVASYLEKVELFFEANNIAEEKKVVVFLAAIGQKSYEILRQHSAPKLPRERSYKEIVTLFKQHSTSGSNIFQRLSTRHKAQDPENASKPSTDSARSQTSGKQRWKDIVGKIITHNKEEQGSGNSKDADEGWELSLTDQKEELDALQELGLGVAIDITAKHPWVTKSAYQAKPVTKDELVVINESNRSQRSREQVETYTSIQQGLESSFRPDPTTPINVTVAADFHRSNSRSKTISSETILTRTVAFRAKDPLERSRDDLKGKESFETNLHKWLVKRKCYPAVCGEHTEDSSNGLNCGLYTETTNHHCIDYLKELGGVTHYVSSITLGATKYQVTLNSTLFTSLSSSSEVSAHTFASATTRSKASKKVFQVKKNEQHIGKIPEGNGDILQFRTKREAVVKCSYNSLANLVSHPQLRKFLERGINEYIDLKKNGTRGPYHICTAELILTKDRGEENSGEESSGEESGGEKKKSRLYWMIDWNNETSSSSGTGNDHRYNIVSTADNKKASNFYLKPIVHCASDKYFWIVTDPEDHGGQEKSMPQDDIKLDKSKSEKQKHPHSGDCKPTSNGTGKHVTDPEDHKDREKSQPQDDKKPKLEEQKQPRSDECKPTCTSNGSGKHEPQRYVSMCKDNHLVVELNITPRSAKKSALKLKNSRDDQTYPLHKSQWLPEALRGSQPYIIGREGKSFRTGLKKDQVCSVYIKKEGKKITYGEHKEGENGHGFFILETGHKT